MIRKMTAAVVVSVAGIVVVGSAFSACVGDDPLTTENNTQDAGPSSPSDASTNNPIDAPNNNETDAGNDAEPSGPCDPTKPFLAPELAPDLNDPAANIQTISVRLSFDGLLAFYSRGPVGGDQDLYRASRTSTREPFGTGVKVEFVNAATIDSKPSVTQDLNTLYYYKGRGGALSDIFRATRTANGYEELTLLGAPVNTPEGAQDPYVSLDGSQLFFTTQRGGAAKTEIWVAMTPNASGFASATKVMGLDGAAVAFIDTPVLSSDMRTLYFGGGSATDTGVWMAKRNSPTGDFMTPEKIKGAAELDLAGQRDEPSFITPDDCVLYMYSNRSGTFQTYRARRQR